MSSGPGTNAARASPWPSRAVLLQLIPESQPSGRTYFGQAQAAGQLASAAACSDDGTFDLMMSMHT